MKTTSFVLLGVATVTFALPSSAQNLTDWRSQLKSGATLGSVRRVFSNQKVIVTGPVFDLGGSFLLAWQLARQGLAGRYDEIGFTRKLPSAYKGKTAAVLAVQVNERKLRDLRPNALGEIVAEDGIVDPYFDIVVQFDDGTLAMCTGYPSTIDTTIELASAASALTERMNKELPLLVGKTVYAVGWSKLYQPDTSLEDMTGIGSSRGSIKQLWATDVPLLQPITVLVAKYIDSTGVVFKLKLPNGKEALAFTSARYYLDSDSDRPFLHKVLGTLRAEMPKGLTQKEVDAIKNRSVFRGMTKDALDYATGFTDKENDWGRGGKQLVYYDGRLIVYLDADNKVTDWQSLDK